MSYGAWKVQPVFVTGTFRDMHAERDWLVDRVFPALAERLGERRCRIEPVDLRIGVETVALGDAPARELAVLKVCLGEVARSRPFLVVLLGDRYGFVPPAERAALAAQEVGFGGPVAEKSVTQLEIEFGVLADPARCARCFFYFREPLPYAAMPPEKASTYSDAHRGAEGVADAKRLAELKDAIRAAVPERVRTYRVGWDAARQCATDLESFGNRVLEDLWRELDAETSAAALGGASTWQETEQFVEERRRDFVGRAGVLGQLTSLATSLDAEGGPWGACIHGPSGAGKSALFARLQAALEERGALVLAHAAGISARSSRVESMLRGWSARLGRELSADVALADEATYADVERTFQELLGRAAKTRRVVLLVDALDQFERTARARRLAWLPAMRIANVRWIATTIAGVESDAASERAAVRVDALAPLEADEADALVRRIYARHHREVAPDISRVLLEKRLPDDSASHGSPLWVQLAAEQLNLLDADDFARAEREFSGSPDERLHQLALHVADELPVGVAGLYDWMLARNGRVFGSVRTRAFVGLLAIARNGWRETDLGALLPRLSGVPWDALRFAELRRAFRGQVVQRGAHAQWDFAHVQMREAVRCSQLADAASERALHAAAAAHLAALPLDDGLRETELMHHLAAACDLRGMARCYGGDLTDAAVTHATASLAESLLVEADRGRASRDDVLALVRALPLDGAASWMFLERCVHALDTATRELCTLDDRSAFLTAVDDAIARLRGQGVPANLWLKTAADCKDRLGDLAELQRDRPRALAAYRAALDLREFRARMGDVSEGHRRDVTISHNKIGDELLTLGRVEEALKEFREAFELRSASGDEAGDALARRDLSASHARISLALELLDRLAEALVEIEHAVAIRRSLAGETLDDEACQRDLDTVRHRQARLLARLDRRAEARAILVEVRERGIERIRRYPANMHARRDLAVTYEALAAVELADGDVTAGMAQFVSAAEALGTAVAHDPDNPTWMEHFVQVLSAAADIQLAHGDRAERTFAQAARRVLEPLLAREPQPGAQRAMLGVLEASLAEIAHRKGDDAAARDGFERAVAIFGRVEPEKLVGASLERAFHAYGRLATYLMVDPARVGDAERSVRRAIEIGEDLARRPACPTWIRGDLGADHETLGRLQAHRGAKEEAHRSFVRAAELVDCSLEENGDNQTWVGGALELHMFLLQPLEPDEFLPNGAESRQSAERRRVVALTRRLVDVARRQGGHVDVRVVVLSLLAGVELAIRERDEALAHLKEALALRRVATRKHYEPGVALDVERIVQLEMHARRPEPAIAALRDGIALVQGPEPRSNPIAAQLWASLGKLYEHLQQRAPARDARFEAYATLLAKHGAAHDATRCAFRHVLALDTLLGEFERGGRLCLEYFAVHPQIVGILETLEPTARDAARVFAVRMLVLPPEQLAQKTQQDEQVYLAAQYALQKNGVRGEEVDDRLIPFFEEHGEALLGAAAQVMELIERS